MMADSSREYKLRQVIFKGQKKLIILQNSNQWSAIVEIANLLILDEVKLDGIKIKKKDGEQYILLSTIHDVIYAHLHMTVKLLEGKISLAVNSIMPSYQQAILQPSSNFSMYPSSFKSTQDFEETLELYLLNTLRMDTYHGWILDPKDTDTSKAVGAKSCKELMEELKEWQESKSKRNVHKMSLIQRFLDKSRTQLTSFGLACLCKDVPEGCLSLLFRDDRLSVLYKHKGTLHTLVTSQNVLKKHPDAVWRKMEKVDEEHVEYVTGTFDPINKSWQTNAEILVEEEAKDKKKKLRLEKKKQKPKKQKKLVAQGESGEADLSEEMDDITHEAKEPQPEKEVDTLTNRFVKFLEEYTHDGKKYFKGQVESMLLTGSLHLMFCYHLIKTHDEELAKSICNNYHRVVEDLRECFCDYFSKIQEESAVIQEKLKFAVMDQTEIFTKIKLTICCIPQRKRILSFKEFVGVNVMYKVYEFDGIYVNSTSYVGRMMALGYLLIILQTHKEGWSWDGGFDESHLSVKIKKGNMKFKIKRTASMVNLKRESGIADFNQYKEIIFPQFKRPDVEGFPAYFDQFISDYMAMPDPYASPEDFKKFRKYMKSHMFAKAPLVRSSLISNTYQACDSLIIRRPQSGHWAVYKDLHVNDGKMFEWDSNSFSAPLRNIYTYNEGPLNKFDTYTYWTALMLGRHTVQHLHMFTMKNKAQTVKDLVIIDLRLAHELNGLMANIIKYIIMNLYKVDAPFSNVFSSVWRTFKASETFEKSTKDAALDGDTKTITEATVTIPSLGSTTATSSGLGPPTGPAAEDSFLMLECEMKEQLVKLSCKDLVSLEDEAYLLDSVIDFSFARISLKFINHSDILLMRTSTAYLIAKEEKKNLQALTQHLELESRRLVFVPVNDDTTNRADGGTHWSLMVIHIDEDRSSCRFVHHDSSMSAWNLLASNRYANALKHLFPMASIDVIQAKTPLQKDSFNCGLCVVALTNEICTWWNRRGRSGKSNSWFETVEKNVTESTYADTRLKLRKNLKSLALATATAAALDFAAGTGVAPALGTATPLPAPNLKCELQDKMVELFYKDLTCLQKNETYVVDNVIKFVYTRISMIYQSQDLQLLWPMDDNAKAKSLGSCRMVLLPVCDNTNSMPADQKHWSLLVVHITLDCSSCRFVHHDLGGLNKNAASKYVKALQQLLGVSPPFPPVVEESIPEQVNPSDSGLYVLALTNAICARWTRVGRWSGSSKCPLDVVNWGDTLAEIRVRLRQNLMKEMGPFASGPTN